MGKLVRDGIPDLIRRTGGDPEVSVLDDDAYRQALQAKLAEEAGELAEAAGEEVAEELADLLEVLRAIADVHGHSWRHVEQVADAKRARRGAFAARLYLH
ncbi:phosphoribosyl-ATP pyrophosphohydrolase [Herbidospora sp. NEAU-GS84]|uniref:Phosphoribosyl-ATP pyrophosphohydrolase n=1 Tax=Herbidospora solisilvae TaxID=2696284 RepID=A0A7C9J145_9ACTN|nr:nucleoside triphosphate pyrophosphohydrolase [Herbidospora solisilvae]NAS21446.1 phosphoribosyl-ATP pyrophosphohydrolase [Herbidospora solisilvae]